MPFCNTSGWYCCSCRCCHYQDIKLRLYMSVIIEAKNQIRERRSIKQNQIPTRNSKIKKREREREKLMSNASDIINIHIYLKLFLTRIVLMLWKFISWINLIIKTWEKLLIIIVWQNSETKSMSVCCNSGFFWTKRHKGKRLRHQKY